ncbi:hypothetical protein [Otoolea muris]|nr:hypothetical protein [Otoolea muris]
MAVHRETGDWQAKKAEPAAKEAQSGEKAEAAYTNSDGRKMKKQWDTGI